MEIKKSVLILFLLYVFNYIKKEENIINRYENNYNIYKLNKVNHFSQNYANKKTCFPIERNINNFNSFLFDKFINEDLFFLRMHHDDQRYKVLNLDQKKIIVSIYLNNYLLKKKQFKMSFRQMVILLYCNFMNTIIITVFKMKKENREINECILCFKEKKNIYLIRKVNKNEEKNNIIFKNIELYFTKINKFLMLYKHMTNNYFSKNIFISIEYLISKIKKYVVINPLFIVKNKKQRYLNELRNLERNPIENNNINIKIKKNKGNSKKESIKKSSTNVSIDQETNNNITKLNKFSFLIKSKLRRGYLNIYSSNNKNESKLNNEEEYMIPYFATNQEFIRSEQGLTSLKIKGKWLMNFKGDELLIFDSFVKCEGKIIANVKIKEKKNFYILTHPFKFSEKGTFIICVQKKVLQSIGLVKIQKQIVDEFDSLIDMNLISKFNCINNDTSTMVLRNDKIRIISSIDKGIRSILSLDTDRALEMKKNKFNLLACSTYREYITLLDKELVVIMDIKRRQIEEAIFHHLTNPVDIFLDGYRIFITDADRKNIFYYNSIFLKKKYDDNSESEEENIKIKPDLDKNDKDLNLNSDGIENDNKLAEKEEITHGQMEENLTDENEEKNKDSIENNTIKYKNNVELDYITNGDHYILHDVYFWIKIINSQSENKIPEALMDGVITLIYPAGIVVVENKVYFVDTGLHMLFCFCLIKKKIIQTFGYHNIPVKNKNGLDKPYSLSLFKTNHGRRNLLFLSELSSSRILIFETYPVIKLYLTYNNIVFDINTSVLTTPLFLIVCGLKYNNENFKSYITFININELSEIEIEYDEFPNVFKNGELFNFIPLIKSDNIKKFEMKVYERHSKNLIKTGLNIDKQSGVISGRITISARFDIKLVVYDFFKYKVLNFSNFLSTCPKGHYFILKTCLPCPVGFYSTYSNILNCISCNSYKPNSTTFHSGSISKYECLCKPGYYLREGKCQKCPLGFYKDQIGDFTCQFTCDNNQISTVKGAASYEELKCICKDGYYLDDRSKCVPCPLNNYCLYNPHAKNKADIIPCKKNRLTLKRAADSDKYCLCAPGYFYDSHSKDCKICDFKDFKGNISNDLCNPFKISPTSTQEFLTNENYIEHYNNKIGKTTSIIFSSKKGSTSLHDAYLCETGYFYSMNKSICSVCRYNNYCEGLDHTIMPCPQNSVTIKLKSFSILDCLCEKGYGRIIINKLKSFTISCVLCPYDTFQPHHSSGECIPCPTHTFTMSVGSTSITDCLPKRGYYNEFFEHIYKYSKKKLMQKNTQFLQYFHLYLNNQYKKINKKIKRVKNDNCYKAYYESKSDKDTDNDNNIIYESYENKNYSDKRDHHYNRIEKYYKKDNCDYNKKYFSKNMIYNNYDKEKLLNGNINKSKYMDIEENKSIINFPKIYNRIHNLKGVYSNVFHTNYLKNILLMDSYKTYQFLEENGSIFYVNEKKDHEDVYDIAKHRSELIKKNIFDKRQIRIKSRLKRHSVKNLSNPEKKNKRFKKNKNRISYSVKHKNLVNYIDIVAQKKDDIIKTIKIREENYSTNITKAIIYECYESEKKIILGRNAYISTIPELDVISCLNVCISNIYCTGIEMDKKNDKGKIDLSFILYKSSGKEMISFYKCNLYFYEEIKSYYINNNLKEITNVIEYDDTGKIVNCAVERNKMLKLWKIYVFNICPNNYYCNRESFEKSKCPLNSVKRNYKGTIEKCLCLPGFFLKKDLNICIPCEKGTYKNIISNDECMKCPLNFTTSDEGSNSIYDCTCREGYYFSGSNTIKLIDIKKEKDVNRIKESQKKNNLILTQQNDIEDREYNLGKYKSKGRKKKFLIKKDNILEKIKNVKTENVIHEKKNEQVMDKQNIILENNNVTFIQKKNTYLKNSHVNHMLVKNHSKKHTNHLYLNYENSDEYHKYMEDMKCLKCPKKMFCPGLWLKNFEKEIHHPPIFCPEGSFIPETTLESTDIHKCLCGKGYRLNLKNKNKRCVKCEARYYKDVIDNSLCAGLCMEFATSFEGSVSKKQCFCTEGKYMIRESSKEMKCVNCSEGSICIGGFKLKSLKNLINNQYFIDLGIYDHVIPFPKKGYFSTFQIDHEDFAWVPLNSLNIEINNNENNNIIINEKIMKNIFHKKLSYITLETNHNINKNENSKIEVNYISDKLFDNLKMGDALSDTQKPILVTEKLEKIKYKNKYLTVDRVPDVHLCPITKRCVGGVNNLCYEGSEGYLCNNCSENYDIIYFRSQCFKCKGTKTELLYFMIRKIFFYILILLLVYMNYFCYLKRNYVFIGILKIWYFFIICFLPYGFILDPISNSFKNYILYFQILINLPLRFIGHYFKFNCFFSSYNNEKYIFIWYIQRFVKITEPIIDCAILTFIVFLTYLIYTFYNYKKINIVQKVIKKQLNNVNENPYYMHVSDFYYHYYQRQMIDTIKNKNKTVTFKKWEQSYFVNEYSSYEDNYMNFNENKGIKKQKNNKTVDTSYDTSTSDNNKLSSFESFSYNKSLLNKNKSSSYENMYNFNDNFHKNKLPNYSIKENISKDKYWTYICLLNIYNIRALGLFRYIHPYNISLFNKIKRIFSDLISVYIIVLYIYFPFILINLLELIWCQQIQYKNERPIFVLYHMPSQVCDFRNKLFLSGVIFSSFFFCGFIILFITYNYSTMRNFKFFYSYSSQLKSYFLFNGHNYQNRCWEFVNIIKIFFVMISFICQLYTKRDNNSKYFICCCIVFILTTDVTLILLYSPYDKRSNNVLHKLGLSSSFSILISYLTLQFNFFFNFVIINILPILLFVYFHIYMINKIILEFAIYENIFKSKEITENIEKKNSEDLLNENTFFFSKQKNNENFMNIKMCESYKKNNKLKKKTSLQGNNNDNNIFDFLLRLNKIPFNYIFFNEKEEEIFLLPKNFMKKKCEKTINSLKAKNFNIAKTRISLDLLHSDLHYYNIRKHSNKYSSNINYSDLKKTNSSFDEFIEKKLSNKSFNSLNKEKKFSKKKYLSNMDVYPSEDNKFSKNVKQFINCLIEAINILFVNQSYNQITVEWLSFITRFSICFIHWMKNHDENLINLVPLNKRQFELKKRNLLFYSLFSSYSETYSIYLGFDKNNKFTNFIENFVKAENLESFYVYLKKFENTLKKSSTSHVQTSHNCQNNDERKNYSYSNFLEDKFYRCEQDLIKMLFDENIFKKLSISLVEFYFAIYMIQFIESKKLSILIFLFCEKKSNLNKEKQFLKQIESRSKKIQNMKYSDNSNKVYEFIEYCYLKESNEIMKKQIKKLQSLIRKKEQKLLKKEKMKSIKCAHINQKNKITNLNSCFVQTLKKLLEEPPSCTNKLQQNISSYAKEKKESNNLINEVKEKIELDKEEKRK
ncbi:cysteine repeat modular protein 3, putative [Plasmodium gallinaceum]|uniref:Cysteine repeat modular protein 3, putative n=1 Tax=Plasmodium gallinaceum TaxID=5849 RepID=A0A1J1GTS1_PLAGA|nr:cysteine repeat modular protein 3, putative [Plasmodium gallinaceum]CRG95926.1 cysteine repeat modular protein 3, putative [Plasmodium gallinaceum]